MVARDTLLKSLPKLAGRSVLVIGDIFLDEYISGQATRLSREAPIPVLEFAGRRYVPGGAANPSNNIVALGGIACQAGVIGDDEAGQTLLVKLREAGIDTVAVVTDPSRPTTTKTRIVAQGSLRFPQQLARIDYLDRRPVAGEVEQTIVAHLDALISQVDAVLISDYRTGVASEAVVAASLKLTRQHGKLATVDSQGNLHKFAGFDLVKCNQREAEAVLGRTIVTEDDFQAAQQQLLAELEVQAILITRGPEGMSLLGRDQPYAHIPAANVSEVFDVTGAGDTVIAVATLALAAGLDLLSAAHLANYAAGLVVRKLGNATATPAELAWAIENW
ncbi:MAG: bifunctional hydroxymethylpyrimidine kinase/phosphomethylpyrimidine kinase [Anaerolineales bacterium]|nr:bifunctional hydroxymethylpyrimidine kinase/phosphomethylpyrimidine kinase [Anaerolineales bacterium]